jgi:hypothetical protein
MVYDKGFNIVLFLTVGDNSVLTLHGKNRVSQLQVTLKSVVFVINSFFR